MIEENGRYNKRNCVLVFSELESNPSFVEVESRPIREVLVNGIRVEA